MALVTCRPGPEVTEDRDLPEPVRALGEAGVEACAVVRDDDGDDGQPRVRELEPVEPHLFLHTGSIPRVVDAIIRATAR
ncbi:hypothetical protein ACFYQA_26955 [Streptomyces sp. NPDC005774]|uniref:hypothetical protein n=1 Tax=Streptomyces sp. NPDC005774 TaxID=3364728 RepID=UPI0036C0ACF5